MNYYGINRKVNVAGYVKGYESPATKRANDAEVMLHIAVPRDANKVNLIEAFIHRYKMTTQLGPRTGDPFGKTITVFGQKRYVDELKGRLDETR